MDLNNYEEKNLSSVCTWERGKKGKLYKKGDFCFRVSATSYKIQPIYLYEDSECKDGDVVFSVTDLNYNPFYVFFIFREFLADFLRRTQTGLNVQPDIFNEMKLPLHKDKETQQYLCETLLNVENLIEKEEKCIQSLNDLKKYHLSKMFI